MFCISVGVPIGEPSMIQELGKLIYTVEYNGCVFELPEVIFLFWEQFLEGEHYEVAKKSFLQQTGFSSDFFDLGFNFLTENNLIIQTKQPLRDFTFFVPIMSKQADATLNEDERKILLLFNGSRCLDEIRCTLEIDNEDTFYSMVLILAKKKTFFFVKGK